MMWKAPGAAGGRGAGIAGEPAPPGWADLVAVRSTTGVPELRAAAVPDGQPFFTSTLDNVAPGKPPWCQPDSGGKARKHPVIARDRRRCLTPGFS